MSTAWVAQGNLAANGKTLEYACVGPSPDDAPTLVLLHEGLGCVRRWRSFPDALAQATGFGVLSYSRAGYGASDLADLPRPLDYMAREACDVLPVVLDVVGVQRAVLIGHSDGASIAAIHAGRIDDSRVRGIILIAPHFFTEAVGLAEIARARDAFEASGDLRERLANYHRNPDNTFHGWNDIWLDPDFQTWTISEVIDNIRVPILAIQGAADQYGTLAQIDELVGRAHVPVDTLIIDNCRHSPHLEQEEIVVVKSREFCCEIFITE